MKYAVDLLTELLQKSGRDLNGLVHVKKYLEREWDTSTSSIPCAEPITAMKSIVSACVEENEPNREYLDIILDTLMFLIDRAEDKEYLNTCGFEIGDLAIKLLTAIERTDKFQIFFCKLLSSITLLCTYSSKVWHQVARPLLNVFTNKKFDYEYLERGLKSFKTICQSADSTEMLNFAKQNLHLLRSFSMLARRVGDFLAQMDIVELVFLYIHNDRTLCPGFFAPGNRQINELLEKLDLSEFERDSRALINSLNQSMASERKVFTISCIDFYFGNVPLSHPAGTNGIWLDVSRDSKRIYVSCSDFRPKSSSSDTVVLQIPLGQVSEIQCDLAALNGRQYYSINIQVDNLKEMYEFAKGHLLSCAALCDDNSRDSVIQFLRTIEELSTKKITNKKILSIFKTNRHENNKLTFAKDSGIKVSCTSPLHISVHQSAPKEAGTQPESIKIESQKSGTSSQMSRTSPLILTIRKTEKSSSPIKKIKTYASASESGRNRVPAQDESSAHYPGNKSIISVAHPTLQVHHISSSVRVSQAVSLNDSLFSSSQKTQTADDGENIKNFSIENMPVTYATAGANIQESCRISSDGNGHGNTTPIINNDFVDKVKTTEGRRYSSQIFEEWTYSSEDLIPTQPYPNSDKDKPWDKNNFTSTIHVRSEITEEKQKNNSWLAQNQKKRKNQPEIPSLLDTNGYSYQRWKMPTTSKRSNFWLNKLKGISQKVEDEMKDIFAFSEDDHESDVFIKGKAKLTKKTGLKTSSRKGNEKDKLPLEMCNRSSPREKNRKWNRKQEPGGKYRAGQVQAFGIFGGKTTEGGHNERNARLTDAGTDFGTNSFDIQEGIVSGARSVKSCLNKTPFKQSKQFFMHDIKDVDSSDENRDEEDQVGIVSWEHLSGSRGNMSGKRRASPVSSTLSAESLLRWKKPRESYESENMDDIAESMSLGIGRFLNEMRGRESAMFSKYMRSVEEDLERLRNEEEDLGDKVVRFRKCVEYFVEGCSAYDSSERMCEEIDEVREDLNDFCKTGNVENMLERMDRYLRKIKEEMMLSLEKQLKEFKIDIIENQLSNSSTSR